MLALFFSPFPHLVPVSFLRIDQLEAMMIKWTLVSTLSVYNSRQ